MTFRVRRQLRPSRVERELLANAGEYVEQRAIATPGVPHVVGGHQRHVERAGEVDDESVAALFGEVEVALHVDSQPIAAETAELGYGTAGGRCIAPRGREGE